MKRTAPGQDNLVDTVVISLAVTHGDPIAFLLLWAKGFPLEPGSKEKLATLDLSDNYPATASITTFTYNSAMADLPKIEYLRPY